MPPPFPPLREPERDPLRDDERLLRELRLEPPRDEPLRDEPPLERDDADRELDMPLLRERLEPPPLLRLLRLLLLEARELLLRPLELLEPRLFLPCAMLNTPCGAGFGVRLPNGWRTTVKPL